MGYPRHVTVPSDAHGVYHCVSRCVRRAHLCGEDAATGRSFEHRRRWLEERMLALGEIFAVAVHAYAVMSNHFHVVIEVDPCEAMRWTNYEVARRWLSLCPASDADDDSRARVEALAAREDRVATLRERLGSLSWFMRYLKEPIARRANAEDECTGRFWEGRFRAQALLDETAVLATMVYVDLNPVRAGISDTPERSAHTSVRRRARQAPSAAKVLRPVVSTIRSNLDLMTETQYLELVDWTGRTLHPGKRGTIAGDAPQILDRLGVAPSQWSVQVSGTECLYWRAIGRVESLVESALRSGRRWLCGIGAARRLERRPKPA